MRRQISACLVGDAQGRDDYVSGLNMRISGLGLDNLVNISGHYSDMPTLYAASDLILAPSVRPEAFGRVAIEAGAMGTPVWILLPYLPDWRWLLDRRDSPWYRTAKLFRQASPNNWSLVISEVQQALRKIKTPLQFRS